MDNIETLESKQPRYEYGGPQHEALLASGYGMSAEDARRIIKEREANPALWPYEEYQKARALLAALKTKPVAVSTRQPWRTRQHARVTRAV